jgi:hypothetical protein
MILVTSCLRNILQAWCNGAIAVRIQEFFCKTELFFCFYDVVQFVKHYAGSVNIIMKKVAIKGGRPQFWSRLLRPTLKLQISDLF